VIKKSLQSRYKVITKSLQSHDKVMTQKLQKKRKRKKKKKKSQSRSGFLIGESHGARRPILDYSALACTPRNT
jgi:hypothetical protein